MTKKIYNWLTLDIIIFILVNILLLYLVGDKIYSLTYITLFEFLVFGLATYRIANIISNETVTKPLRAPFVDEKIRNGEIVEEPKKSGFQGAFGLLIYCPSCTGVWVALLLAYLYIYFPIQTLLIAFIFALSGMERIIAKMLELFKRN